MEVCDCVDAALTRARQARLPSPWTEAVDVLDLAARASKKVEHWRAWLCGKQRKSTASGRGEGSGGKRIETSPVAVQCGARASIACISGNDSLSTRNGRIHTWVAPSFR